MSNLAPLPKTKLIVSRAIQRLLRREDTWASHIRKLFQRDIGPLLDVRQSPNKQGLVLFWTPMAPWPHMLIEYAIATNLRLRDYEVLFCVCDGYLPHCEMERANFPRPACETCWQESKRILSAFQLPHKVLSDYVSADEIRTLTGQLNLEQEDKLRLLTMNNIELGKYSFQYLTTYFNGPVTEYGSYEQGIFRRILAGNVLAQKYAERVVQQYKPLAVVMLDGNLCQTFPAFHVFRATGIRVVTWDDYSPYQDSFLFLQNRTTADAAMDEETWLKIKQETLTTAQEARVDSFLQDWPAGRLSDIVYHPQPQKDSNAIRQKLGVDPNRRVFVALTNVIWDSAALGRDIGFKGMMDWLYALCDWFLQHPKDQLVVRVHPAEKRLPAAYRTTNGVAGLIQHRYGDQLRKGSIRIVDAEDDIYSYTLAEMADAIGVYTSSIAIELATRGILPWVAGKVHYRGKGFTIDLEGVEHLYHLLDQDQWERKLGEEGKALARRYLYARVERQVTGIPFLTRHATAYTRPNFKDLQFMIPRHDPQVDTLVDRVLDGKPFIDVPRQSTAIVSR